MSDPSLYRPPPSALAVLPATVQSVSRGRTTVEEAAAACSRIAGDGRVRDRERATRSALNGTAYFRGRVVCESALSDREGAALIVDSAALGRRVVAQGIAREREQTEVSDAPPPKEPCCRSRYRS